MNNSIRQQMYIDNIMDVKTFLKMISHYQEIYWKLEDSIKPLTREKPITAREIEFATQQMNHVAEQVVRFILNRHTKVNIYNTKELPPMEDGE